jgi:hypothetical protein
MPLTLTLMLSAALAVENRPLDPMIIAMAAINFEVTFVMMVSLKTVKKREEED